ncbi:MAG: helix-hairpin-helix domain-containing protein [Peptococcaceae bacterium]|jgi:competence protein ComEA|nr:helix-hairpin-helix domain-containing protein [Peptococcaceae bacterium]MDH7524488.1 helix-hairpin-helix domain-containing protein [Peptococcaceae bacterium]
MLDKLPRKAQVVIAVFLGVFVFFGGIRYYETRLHALKIETEVTIEEEGGKKETGQEKEEPRVLAVHVVGAVEKPGLYSLQEGARVYDAVQLAVPLAEADLAQINLAAPLVDGKQVYVPSKGEKPSSSAAPSYRLGVKSTGLININTAGKEELERLPGIGPALAQRIIEYREKNGPFKKVDEITGVSGIGPSLLEKARNMITVD